MKISEVSKELIESINPVFEKHGFLLNKKNREFKRKVGDFVQIFDLFFYKKSKYISIKPEIRIKSVEIERIYKSNTYIEGRPYTTLGNHLFEIIRYFKKRRNT
jgi:hypothetical protein